MSPAEICTKHRCDHVVYTYIHFSIRLLWTYANFVCVTVQWFELYSMERQRDGMTERENNEEEECGWVVAMVTGWPTVKPT